MPLRFLVWNAQHMDNQSTMSFSNAFQEKLEFLTNYLAQLGDIDVLAFLETGKTGKVNQTLAAALNNLPGSYIPLGHLQQEGGLFKDTTLGISVYVRSDKADQFSAPEFEYALGEKERRAPVLILHKSSKKYLGFYHANANITSFGHIKSAIEYIHENIGKGNLAFFGGDMNYDYHAMHDSLDGLLKIGSGTATHTKFEIVKKRHLGDKLVRRYENIINQQGLKREFNGGYRKRLDKVSELSGKRDLLKRAQLARLENLSRQVERVDSSFAFADAVYDRQYSVLNEDAPREAILVTSRYLDYAFVDSTANWTASCHGTVVVNDLLGGAMAKRLCNGNAMRSDHFPIIYDWTGDGG